MRDQPSGHDSPSREGSKSWTKWALNKARAAWRRATSPKEDWPESPGAKFLWTVTLGHPFAAGLLVVVGLWIVTASIPRRVFPGKPEQAGQFGDTFGLMNALIGGFTLIGVAYAAWLQHEALKDSKKALQESDAERERTLRVMRDQANAMQWAAELNALDSLLQHYSKQIEFNHIKAEASDPEFPAATEPGIEAHRLSMLKDQVLQLVRAKLAEVRLPNPSFNWGVVPKHGQTWAMRHCLTALRETKSKIHSEVYPDFEVHPWNALSFESRLNEFRKELLILASQDGVIGHADHHVIMSVYTTAASILLELESTKIAIAKPALLATIKDQILYLLDENNLYNHFR